MAPTLYMVPYSQPVRATLMTIRALDLNIQLKTVNLLEKQQLCAEYTKLNPQHTVPTLVDDDGFVVWDSHAIMQYLVEKYGNNSSLYPSNDVKLRAILHQRMHFEGGTLFPVTMAIIRPIIYEGVKIIAEEKKLAVLDAYKVLETFFTGLNCWVVGPNVTIADFSICASITTMDVVVPIDAKRFPHITAWIKRMETLPYYDANRIGLMQIRQIIQENLEN